MRRTAFATVMVLASGLLLAPSASANIYTDVLHAYEANGSIPPCQFSSQQLATALKGVDTYGAQYFADFTGAIQAALTSRATGACSHAKATVPPRPSSQPGGPLPAGPITAATGADLPAPMILMAVLAALATLIGGVWWLARVRGWDPAWAAAWRHSWREAGYRLGGAFSELVDRLRSNQ